MGKISRKTICFQIVKGVQKITEKDQMQEIVTN